MELLDRNSLKYLTIGPNDDSWGLVATTVGTQLIESNACYPAMQHPANYNFKAQGGRILEEYQIVYIAEGGGYFESQSVAKQRIDGGTVILLFPGERHLYTPDEHSGWREYWIGFKGEVADKRVMAGFFSTKDALVKIGLSNTLIGLYRDAIRIAEKESIGCQQLLAGIVTHMLGHILYKSKRNNDGSNHTEDIINEARQLMREKVHHTLHAKDISDSLGVGYSWFRQTFKQVTGISPAQYIARLLISRAKEMLMAENHTITEIAYLLGFESVGQFSTTFRKIEGTTPRQFREENKLLYNKE